MKRAIFLVIMGYFCYGSLFSADAETRKRQQPPQQKPGQPTKPVAKPISRPAILGEGILLLPQPDIKKAAQRKEKGNLEESHLNTLTPALNPKAAGQCPVDCLTALYFFVLQVDAFWENDQFQAATVDRYVRRLNSLPNEEIWKWKDEINKIINPLGDDVNQIKTVGFLIQLDALFTENGFSKDKSVALLERLRSLSPNAIKAWKEVIDSYSSQAVIMLIQDDTLFKENKVQGENSVKKTYPSFEVGLTDQWVKSDIKVSKGQIVLIESSGQIYLDGSTPSSPQGINRHDPKAPLPNESDGALIMTIGTESDSPVIIIGRSREFIADRDGTLYFTVNHSNTVNTRGTYQVRVSVKWQT